LKAKQYSTFPDEAEAPEYACDAGSPGTSPDDLTSLLIGAAGCGSPRGLI